MIEKILNRLKDKKILIAGFGREGQSSLSFLKEYLPDAYIGVADKNEAALSEIDVKYHCHFGESYLSCLSDYDIVLKTPGISLKDIDLPNVEISSQTDLFLEAFHDKIIGVTGTKGKSTTSSLIYHLLKESGKEAILAGNIGIPIFNVIDEIKSDTAIVFEMSAHQLEFIGRSPHVGVLLNLYEEHLDHFGSFERYCNAKCNIFRKMEADDIAIVGDQAIVKVKEANVRAVNFSQSDFNIEWEKLPLQGSHNVLNVKAALCACRAFGLDVDELVPHLMSFRPLEHRQEFVGTFNGLSFYNDSISTIPQATIAALQTIQNVDYLLLGGYDRGIGYQPLVDFLLNKPVKCILYTGEAGKRIHKSLEQANYQGNTFFYDSLEDAFEFMEKSHSGHEKCLLSPAAASYDRYKNFEERGRKFKELARQFKSQ